jgi:hypothetical protein
VKHGVGRGVEYTLAELRRVHQEYDRQELREDVVWSSLFAPLVRDLPDKVRDIWRYGFTEMVNNAIDHSGANTISIWGVRNALCTQAWVADDGEGIFNLCGFNSPPLGAKAG